MARLQVIVPAGLLAALFCIGPAARAESLRSHPGLFKIGMDLYLRQGWYKDAVDRLYKREFVQMLSAIMQGSQMGPGEGWFHPGQSLYGWKWLAAHYDQDHDGEITLKEFQGPASVFHRLDRDHDGVLAPEDFDWSDKSDYVRQGRQGAMLFYLLDPNSNGRINSKEWDRLFSKLAGDKRYITPDDMKELFRQPQRRKKDKKPEDSGPPVTVFLKGLLTGELGSFFEGPAIGEQAPDFTLPTYDGKQQLSLGQFLGQKPVVLIFGSFT
jgi:EF hand domain-containing protein